MEAVSAQAFTLPHLLGGFRMAGDTIAKRTVAERIADRLGIGQAVALQVVQAFLDEMVVELAAGNRLEFRDFGVFETVERKPRTALNPKTLEKVPVDRKVVVKFKPGRLMKEEVAKLAKRTPESPSAPPSGSAPGLASDGPSSDHGVPESGVP